MSRLIVISNRIPLDKPPSGGLVVAMHECLQETGGIWIGSAEKTVEEVGDGLTEHPAEGYRKFTFELTEQDRQEYYLGYANAVLWPLCHRRGDLLDLRPNYFDGYMRVNRRLAEMLAPRLEENDRLWIHDYHFFPLAKCLRELGVRCRIGFFLHIPFPALNDLDKLSNREMLLDWVASFDLVGLQSQADVAGCLAAYRKAEKGELYPDGMIGYDGRTFRAASFPIGIDARRFREEALSGDGADMLGHGPGAGKLVIGVDRLDYSKGLPQRLRAFATYLSRRSDADPRATLLQIAPPTREELPAYRAIREELEQIAGTENGTYAELDWTPIKYIHKPIPRQKLAALFRAADAGLVTPLADGMNLVAKEFIAAQDPEDPGVLVLSRFAGAAEQLTSAVIVNPYDIANMADGIAQALSMSLQERQERYEEAARNVFEQDISWWAQTYLRALTPSD